MAKKNKNGSSKARKLTASDVLKMRKLYATGKKTMAELSAEFGVNISGVSCLINRKTWNDLKDEQGTGKWHPSVKNRKPRRKSARMSKRLTRDQAIAIRKEYAKGNVTQAQLAEKYGVTGPAISSIICERSHGGKRSLVKIAPTEYAAILAKYKKGASLSKIAEQYDVSQPAIYRIVRLHSGKKAEKAAA